jgi:hypothetical protein
MSLLSKRGRDAFEKAFRPPSSKAFSLSVPISARAEKQSRSPTPSLISLAARREPLPSSFKRTLQSSAINVPASPDAQEPQSEESTQNGALDHVLASLKDVRNETACS